MTAYQQLIEQLWQNVALQRTSDGFEASNLRRSIIKAVEQLELPATPPENVYARLSPDNKIRIGYLSQCGKAGAEVCTELLNRSIVLAGNCCYREYILVGAAEIGSTIGLEYGRALYPEQQKIRPKHSKPSPKTAMPSGSYGFTVYRYENYFELEEVQFQPVLAQFDLQYDNVNERYIEFYSFPDENKAKSAHRKWQNFINGKKSTPPVKYGFEVETDSPEGIKVYGITPFNDSDKSTKTLTAAGVEREIRIFRTFAKALEQNRKTSELLTALTVQARQNSRKPLLEPLTACQKRGSANKSTVKDKSFGMEGK